MRENSPEIQKVFKDLIPLGVKMSPQEAVEKLAEFHSTSTEAIISAFLNLRGFEEGTVEFRNSVNSGYPCIVMEGCDKEGHFVWNDLIDEYTGQPQVRCG